MKTCQYGTYSLHTVVELFLVLYKGSKLTFGALLDADRDMTVYRMDCGSRWRKERKNEERSPGIYIGGHGDDRMYNISNSYDDIY